MMVDDTSMGRHGRQTERERSEQKGRRATRIFWSFLRILVVLILHRTASDTITLSSLFHLFFLRLDNTISRLDNTNATMAHSTRR